METLWRSFCFVSLSGDGKILAVGGDLNDTGGTDSGHIKLYNYVNNQWSQIGSTISGDTSGDQLGFNPLVSRDGTLVIVPVLNDDTTNGDDSGSVRLYNLVDSTNSSPVATAQTVDATEDVAKTITLAGTDADGDTITYIIATLPSNGTLTDNGDCNYSDDLPKQQQELMLSILLLLNQQPATVLLLRLMMEL